MDERFTILNKKMRIVGIRNMAHDRPRPTAILLHGFTGSKNEAHDLLLKTSNHLVSHGFNTVRFDFRYGKTETNCNESDGQIAEMTPSEWISDARRMVGFVSRDPRVDVARIALIGISMGGLTAICEAARDERVAAVVAWSAPSDLSSRLHNEKRLKSLESIVCRRVEGFKRSVRMNVPKKSILLISPRPILIVAGSADDVVPVQEARELFENTKDPRSLYVLGGADHTFSKHEAEVIPITASWLQGAFRTGWRPRPAGQSLAGPDASI